MEVLVTVGGSILSGILKLVINKAIEKSQDDWISSRLKLRDALEELHDTLSIVVGLVIDAEKRAYFTDDKVAKDWVARLRDAMFDADDILDELEYKNLKRLNAEGKFANYYHKNNPFQVFEHGIIAKIKKIEERFKSILNKAEKYKFLKSNIDCIHSQGRTTTSILDTETGVISRDAKRDYIIQLLTEENTITDDKPILSIVGHGGIGKTTLAQMIYNHEMVKGYFDLKIWVCVSNVFDVQKILKHILESLYHSIEKTQIGCKYENFDVLVDTLVKELKGRRFLLVLDDVWNEDANKWKEIANYLKVANTDKRSKILVTTRSKSVAKIIESSKTIQLDGFTNDELWPLFRGCAFGTVNELEQEFEKIAQNIMKKLKGSPLAAKTVGRILRSNPDKNHWNNILNNEIWMLPQNNKDIMPALGLSYQYLPEHLKPCFALCSLYPKDYIYNKRQIVSMWISLGYIPNQHGSVIMEETGEKYVNELLHRFMFESCNDNETPLMAKYMSYDAKDMFKIHDLVHDLAKMVSTNESLMIHDEFKPDLISSSIRNLSIFVDAGKWIWNEHGCFDHLHKIQTLIFLHKDKMLCKTNVKIPDNFYIFLQKLLSKMKSLRILDLSFFEIKELPLPKLKHLRYLNMYGSKLKKLPTTLAHLYQLQFLDCECLQEENRKAPSYIRNLVYLRQIYGLIIDLDVVPNLEKFHFLQALRFNVTKQHQLKALQGKNELRMLSIGGLENVQSKEEALDAGLKNMIHLNRLTMEWCADLKINNADEVLQALHPHTKVAVLEISDYPGKVCPSWMENLSTLRDLRLVSCNLIKYISIRGLKEIKFLAFVECECLGIQDGYQGFRALTSLENLVITDCNNLVEDLFMEGREGLPSSLKEMTIVYTGSTTINVASSILQSLTNLTRLVVGSDLTTGSIIPSPTSPPKTQHIQQLRTLIIYCCSAEDVKGWLLHLHSCKSLVDITLCCPNLYVFDTEMEDALVSFVSLRELWLEELSSCHSLPTRLRNICSLKELTLQECPQIECLPKGGLPAGLQVLDVWSCPLLEKHLKEIGNELGDISVRHLHKDGSLPSRMLGS